MFATTEGAAPRPFEPHLHNRCSGACHVKNVTSTKPFAQTDVPFVTHHYRCGPACHTGTMSWPLGSFQVVPPGHVTHDNATLTRNAASENWKLQNSLVYAQSERHTTFSPTSLDAQHKPKL